MSGEGGSSEWGGGYRHGQQDGRAEMRPHLRDQFAMAALTGLLSAGLNWPRDQIADTAYAMADAMLAEREKRK